MKYLDPDDPEWCDDRRDLAFVREFDDSVPAEVEDAVCRLGRWKRLLAAAERYAVEQGWVSTALKGEHPIVDRKRLAAAGVPLLQWRRERKRLIRASMWPAESLAGHRLAPRSSEITAPRRKQPAGPGR